MPRAGAPLIQRVGVLLLVASAFVQASCSREPIHRPVADQLSAEQLALNCIVPVLDGNGLRASEISLAHTPEFGYTEFPAPVLAQCREPLAEGVPDMRGVWVDTALADGHLERISSVAIELRSPRVA